VRSQAVIEREPRVGILLRLAINTLAIYLTAELIPGVEIRGFLGAVVAAVVLAVVNTFVKPVLIILTLPITVITLGIFLFILNGLSLMLAAWIAGDAFDISGLGPAILAWLVFWILNWLITGLFQRRRVRIIEP
jgi:putative membrane protein